MANGSNTDMAENEIFPHLSSDADTVSFQFNDGRRVTAARPFLTYISPVFSAMFQNEWKDSTTGVCVIEDIKREDFVEFLQCLDPGIMKNVTDSNVLRVCPIADKYQSPALMQKCRVVLTNIINKIIKDQENSNCFKPETKLLKSLLEILHTINKIDAYKDETDEAIDACSLFSSRCYRREKCLSNDYGRHKGACVKLFEQFPLELQYKILKKRLDKWDKE